MDWPTFWTSVLGGVGGAAGLTLLFVWPLKRWLGTHIEKSITHEYDKKLETHKAELKQEATTAIRKMEAEFQEAVDRQAADKELFRRFLATLPSRGSIGFIRTNNFAGFSFRTDRLRHLDEFYYEWDNVEHEFLDEELERKRKQLHQSVTEFLDYLSLNTWPLDGDVHSSWVPPEWEHTQPKRFWETVNKLHELARRVVEQHADLVRAGREKLKVVSADSDAAEPTAGEKRS